MPDRVADFGFSLLMMRFARRAIALQSADCELDMKVSKIRNPQSEFRNLSVL